MLPRQIPLFPLHVVVFPRTRLPLHIFEERYKEMIGNAIRDHSEFGIVLAKEDGIVNTGCTVEIENVVRTYPDGRMDILTRGRSRFEILSINEEKSWLEGEVDYFDDEDVEPAPEELRMKAVANYEALRAFSSSGGRGEPDLSDRQLSFQLAQFVPDVDFQSTLLIRRSETDRLKEINQYLTVYIPRQRAIERIKAAAPLNGSGTAPADL